MTKKLIVKKVLIALLMLIIAFIIYLSITFYRLDNKIDHYIKVHENDYTINNFTLYTKIKPKTFWQELKEYLKKEEYHNISPLMLASKIENGNLIPLEEDHLQEIFLFIKSLNETNSYFAAHALCLNMQQEQNLAYQSIRLQLFELCNHLLPKIIHNIPEKSAQESLIKTHIKLLEQTSFKTTLFALYHSQKQFFKQQHDYQNQNYFYGKLSLDKRNYLNSLNYSDILFKIHKNDNLESYAKNYYQANHTLDCAKSSSCANPYTEIFIPLVKKWVKQSVIAKVQVLSLLSMLNKKQKLTKKMLQEFNLNTLDLYSQPPLNKDEIDISLVKDVNETTKTKIKKITQNKTYSYLLFSPEFLYVSAGEDYSLLLKEGKYIHSLKNNQDNIYLKIK